MIIMIMTMMIIIMIMTMMIMIGANNNLYLQLMSPNNFDLADTKRL